MKPFSKAMKIENMHNLSEQEPLSAFLTSFREARHVKLNSTHPDAFSWRIQNQCTPSKETR